MKLQKKMWVKYLEVRNVDDLSGSKLGHVFENNTLQCCKCNKMYFVWKRGDVSIYCNENFLTKKRKIQRNDWMSKVKLI